MYLLFAAYNQQQLPIPNDLPLDLPMPEGVLKVILVISFLLHLLFINLMMGGSILCLFFEIKGLKNKEYDTLARKIADTITVNKSLAIVLGVAPLLTINVLYTLYFYSANALTGTFWIAIVPWVTMAFLLLYWHKYSWDKMQNNKEFHIAMLAVVVCSFLFIPLIFLSNINLMLFPEKWSTVNGFFSTLLMANVFPRYFHFIAASITLTAIFLYGYSGSNAFKMYYFQSLDRPTIQKQFMRIALASSLCQLIFGPIVLFTLPPIGVSWNMILIICAGTISGLWAMWQMWLLLNRAVEVNRKIRLIGMVLLLTITIGLMGTGRQMYRANALKTHQVLVKVQTEKHQELVAMAHQQKWSAEDIAIATESVIPGEELFNSHCKVCHGMHKRLVGPPMTELIPIYENNLTGLKQWIKTPGRKREDYPQMMGFPQLSDDQLTQLSEYVLSIEKNERSE